MLLYHACLMAFFVMMAWFPCCCMANSCLNCQANTAPDNLQVVITSVVGSGPGGNCNVINGTWTIPWAGTAIVCLWSKPSAYSMPCLAASSGIIRIDITNDAVNYFLTVIATTGAGASAINWSKTLGLVADGPPDCSAFSSENVPHVSSLGCCSTTTAAVITSL